MTFFSYFLTECFDKINKNTKKSKTFIQHLFFLKNKQKKKITAFCWLESKLNVSSHCHSKNLWHKFKKSSDVGLSMESIALLPFFFLERRLATRSCLPSIWGFLKFPHFVRSSVFGNSLGNSYIKLLVLIIKFRFTCGEGKLCKKKKSAKTLFGWFYIWCRSSNDLKFGKWGWHAILNFNTYFITFDFRFLTKSPWIWKYLKNSLWGKALYKKILMSSKKCLENL